MGTVLKSNSSKNIGLKSSWGGTRYGGSTISIVKRGLKINKLRKSGPNKGQRKEPCHDIIIDESLRINKHQAKFLIKILRTELVRKKLANDLESWVKGTSEEDHSCEWLG
tara:strand:+ start:1119 stop:1448 length:330 start_codon:yes stop_codon:yes gene_type:complete